MTDVVKQVLRAGFICFNQLTKVKQPVCVMLKKIKAYVYTLMAVTAGRNIKPKPHHNLTSPKGGREGLFNDAICIMVNVGNQWFWSSIYSRESCDLIAAAAPLFC